MVMACNTCPAGLAAFVCLGATVLGIAAGVWQVWRQIKRKREEQESNDDFHDPV